MTMAMNASSTTPPPIWGERLVIVPRMTPAAPARADPTAKTSVFRRPTSTPRTAAIVGSWVAARMARPSEVRSTISQTRTASVAAATSAKIQYAGSVTRPSVTAPSSAAGRASETTSAPQTTLAMPSKKSESPKVSSSGSRCDSGNRTRSGRSSQRSTAAPSRPIASGASARPSQKPPSRRETTRPT